MVLLFLRLLTVIRLITNFKDSGRVADPTPIHSHLSDLLFDFRPVSAIAIRANKGATWTLAMATFVPLFTGLRTTILHNNIITATVWAKNRL
jgi:hypothetical protein